MWRMMHGDLEPQSAPRPEIIAHSTARYRSLNSLRASVKAVAGSAIL